jgi:hypothetical protein
MRGCLALTMKTLVLAAAGFFLLANFALAQETNPPTAAPGGVNMGWHRTNRALNRKHPSGIIRPRIDPKKSLA